MTKAKQNQDAGKTNEGQPNKPDAGQAPARTGQSDAVTSEQGAHAPGRNDKVITDEAGAPSNETMATYRAEERCEGRRQAAVDVALAVLRGPNAHIVLAGQVLDPTSEPMGTTQGALLARKAYKFAKDFVAELEAQYHTDRADAYAQELEALAGPGSEPENTEGGSQDGSSAA